MISIRIDKLDSRQVLYMELCRVFQTWTINIFLYSCIIIDRIATCSFAVSSAVQNLVLLCTVALSYLGLFSASLAPLMYKCAGMCSVVQCSVVLWTVVECSAVLGSAE